MKILIAITLIYSFSSLSQNAIIGGQNGDLKNFPWSVYLTSSVDGENWRYACGGSIISKKFILTAGHCVFAWEGLDWKFRVYGKGDGSVKKLVRLGNVKMIHMHPKLTLDFVSKPIKIRNDIALIEMEEDIVFDDSVKPIKLIHPSQSLNKVLRVNGFTSFHGIAGWGLTAPPSKDPKGKSSPKHLQYSYDVKAYPLFKSRFWKKEKNRSKYLPVDPELGDYAWESFMTGNFILSFSKSGELVRGCSGDSGTILFRKTYNFRTHKFESLGWGVHSFSASKPWCESLSASVNIQNYWGWIFSIVDL